MSNVNNQPIITDIGRKALANAKSKGTNLIISHLAVGSGVWQADKTATALKQQIKRINANGYQDLAPSQVRVEFIDDTSDSYRVYEIGLITEAGDLFAIYSSNDKNKPLLEKAIASRLLQSYNLGFNDASNISFTPGTLSLPQSTEEVKGVSRTAKDSDMTAGSDDTKIVTPKKLSQNIIPIKGLTFPDGYTQKTAAYNLTNQNGTARFLDPTSDLNTLFTSGIFCGVPKNNPVGDTNSGREWYNFIVVGNGKDAASQFAIPWSNLGRGICVRTTQRGASGWSQWAKLNTQDTIYNSTGCKIDFANGVLNFYWQNKKIAWVGDGDIHLAAPENTITFGDNTQQKTASWPMVGPAGRTIKLPNGDMDKMVDQAGHFAGVGFGWVNGPIDKATPGKTVYELGFLSVYPYADNKGCYQEFVSFEDSSRQRFRKYSRMLSRDGKTWSAWQRIDCLLVDKDQFCFNTGDWNGHTETKFHYSWDCKNSPFNKVFYNGFTAFVDDGAHKKTFQLIQDDQGRVYSRSQYIGSDQKPSEQPYTFWVRNDNTPDAIKSDTLKRTQNKDGSLQVDLTRDSLQGFVQPGDVVMSIEPITHYGGRPVLQACGKYYKRSDVAASVAQKFPLESTYVRTGSNMGGLIQCIEGARDGSFHLASIQASGRLWRSVDNGSSWKELTNHPAYHVSNIYSIAISYDGSLCIAVGDNGMIMTSTDKGASWTKQTPAAGWPNFKHVAISNDKSFILACGSQGSNKIQRSLDGGKTWQVVPIPTGSYNNDMYCCYVNGDGNYGLICGDNSIMFVTTNKGQSLTQIQGINSKSRTNHRYPLHDNGSGQQAVVTNSMHANPRGNTLIVAGPYGWVSRMLGDGMSFTQPEYFKNPIWGGPIANVYASAVNDYLNIRVVRVSEDGNYCLFGGANGSLYRSLDAGKTWDLACQQPNMTDNISIPTNADISSLYIGTGQDRFMVGLTNGEIYTAGLSEYFLTPNLSPYHYIIAA